MTRTRVTADRIEQLAFDHPGAEIRTHAGREMRLELHSTLYVAPLGVTA